MYIRSRNSFVLAERMYEFSLSERWNCAHFDRVSTNKRHLIESGKKRPCSSPSWLLRICTFQNPFFDVVLIFIITWLLKKYWNSKWRMKLRNWRQTTLLQQKWYNLTKQAQSYSFNVYLFCSTLRQPKPRSGVSSNPSLYYGEGISYLVRPRVKIMTST